MSAFLPPGCTVADCDGPTRTCECGAPLADPDYDEMCEQCEYDCACGCDYGSVCLRCGIGVSDGCEICTECEAEEARDE